MRAQRPICIGNDEKKRRQLQRGAGIFDKGHSVCDDRLEPVAVIQDLQNIQHGFRSQRTFRKLMVQTGKSGQGIVLATGKPEYLSDFI